MSQEGPLDRFGKYFSLDEAAAILPEIRVQLESIRRIRSTISDLAAELEGAVRGNGDTQSSQPRFVQLVKELEGLVGEVQDSGVILRDPDTGLIDFPSIRDGGEIFLCYRLGEDKIEFWHDLEEGFPGRKPL